MLLTLINDNAAVLNLSRVQPYLEGIDAEIEGDGDDEPAGAGAGEGSEVAFDDGDPGMVGQSGQGEKQRVTTGVRFEDSGGGVGSGAAAAMAGDREAPAWYADPGQMTPGGMRLADMMHTGTTTTATGDKPFATSTERPTTSAAAQQLLDFGNGYAAHTWNGGDISSATTTTARTTTAAAGEDFGAHAQVRRRVSSERRRTRDGSTPLRDEADRSRPPISRAPSLTEHHAALALEVSPPLFHRPSGH